jgi:2-aminoadipate transaminase
MQTLIGAPPPQTDEILLSAWAATIHKSALQEMLMEASRPGILSFALGLPAAEFFPVDNIGRAANRILAHDPRGLQYGPPSPELKSHIVNLMAKRGVICTTENIFLTSGAQQGLNLLARLLLRERSQVLVEEFTYPGFLQVLEPFQADVLTVPANITTGMEVDCVEQLLRRGARPALIYTIPEGHNPLGSSMSEENRRRLAHLARKYQVPVIEDDPYGFLSYDEAPARPLRAFDEQWVLYVGSFSKILAPALRVGWLVVPKALIQKLSIVKEATDIDSATFAQRLVADYLDHGHLPAHLAMLRREYRLRRDTILVALDERFSCFAEWSKPSSGLFVWVQFSESVHTPHLLRDSLATEKVAFIPGSAFSAVPQKHGANCIRLNFSALSGPLIREGMDRLQRTLAATQGNGVCQ